MTIKKRLTSYCKMTKEALLRIQNKSYVVTQPKLSFYFNTKDLSQYFYDFSYKTKWGGKVDNDGIPILQNSYYFPLIIIQKALGHHNRYVETKCSQQKKEFIICCNWILKNIDENDGIKTWDKRWKNGGNKYSAMTQGQAASALARAYLLTNEKKYLSNAHRLIALMISGKFNLLSKVNNIEILDEFPGSRYKHVLNGWIFALFGMHDLFLLTKDKKIGSKLNELVLYLASSIKNYDTGFWSMYDLNGHISSSYYHSNHIVQLEALSIIFPQQEEFKQYYLKFSNYKKNKLFRFYSQAIKLFQKIWYPTESIF